MRKRLILLFTTLLMITFSLVIPVSSQETKPAAQSVNGQQEQPENGSDTTKRPITPQEDSVIKIKTSLISVLVSVTDQKGNLANNLLKDDFEILENGVPQEIQTFGREDSIPLRLALLFDISLSVKPRLKFQQQAATKFFKAVLRPVDKAALFSFSHDVIVEQDFTSDTNQLATATKELKAKGGTALYDAIYLASERLSKGTGRRVIVILSDGVNMISRTNLETSLRMAEKADAAIYAIYTVERLPVETGAVSGEDELKKICERTGGEVFFPKDTLDLDEVFKQLSAVLRAQYALSYTSNNEQYDGSYRKLDVKVKNPELKVRARKGYYAPKL